MSDKKKNQKHNKSIESAHITIENTQKFSAANSTRKFNLYSFLPSFLPTYGIGTFQINKKTRFNKNLNKNNINVMVLLWIFPIENTEKTWKRNVLFKVYD